jgi:flagellar protein FlaG
MSIQPTGMTPARTVDQARDAAPAQPQARSAATSVDTKTAVEKSNALPSQQEVKSAVENINKSMQALSQSLEFSIDEDSKRTIVKVVDQNTKEVIRQIPTPEALEISKALDTVKGLLIKQTA